MLLDDFNFGFVKARKLILDYLLFKRLVIYLRNYFRILAVGHVYYKSVHCYTLVNYDNSCDNKK